MEDFTRRLPYPAATAKAPKKITQVCRASEGCRVLLLHRGRDNKEQVVARARLCSRHPCHVGALVGLEETVTVYVEEGNDC